MKINNFSNIAFFVSKHLNEKSVGETKELLPGNSVVVDNLEGRGQNYVVMKIDDRIIVHLSERKEKGGILLTPLKNGEIFQETGKETIFSLGEENGINIIMPPKEKIKLRKTG